MGNGHEPGSGTGSEPTRGFLWRLAVRVSQTVTAIEQFCLAGGILGIAGLTVGNVLTRTFAGTSLFFAEEMCQFLIVIVTFLGLGHAVAMGRHIRMTAFYDLLPHPWRKTVRLVICASTALLLFFLAHLALRYALGTVRALGSLSPVLEVPLWQVYLAAPVGFFLAGIQYLLAFLRNLSSPEIYLSFTLRDEHIPLAEEG